MPDTKAQPAEHEEPPQDHPVAAKPATTVTPVVAMTFVIVILLTAFFVMRFGPRKDSAEITKLKAELEAVSRQGAPSVGIPGGGEQIEDVATRMKKDADTMVLLSERYQQLVDDTHAEMLRKNADLVRSEQYRQRTTDDLLALKKELERSKSATYEAESLRREVADLKTVRDSQAKELEDLKQQLAAVGEMASKADLADLQRRFEETLRAKQFFESRVKELEGELSKGRLFAKSENELLPAAVELFRKLRTLENKSDLEISKAYSEIGAELGADVLKTMSFPTGSAQMNATDEEPVRQLLANVPDGDMLLVVGYASETGNVDSNQTLSSQRATGVAELLTTVKRPGQLVQAVYLGQTDRFGSRFPERNQCCEVWRIRAKQ